MPLFNKELRLTVVIIICWVIVAIQLGYLGCLLVPFWRKPKPLSGLMPPVSVVVCSRDDGQNIQALVPLLLQQDYPEFEVIVVDDRSNDDTYDYLLRATKVHPKLRMVHVKFLPEHVTGKKFALTLGVKAAAYDWVLLTDADCRPSGDQWLRSMAAPMVVGKEIIVGYSPYTKSPRYLNAFIRFEALITGIQFMGWALLGRPYMGTGRNLAYRKALFFDNKGFNNHLNVMGGDDDLFVNQHATTGNTAVSMGAFSLVYSIPKVRWKDFFYQKLRHMSVGKHYRLVDKVMLGLFSVTWIGSWMYVFPVMLQPVAWASFLWVGFIVRQMVLIALVHRASRTLGDPFEAWKTPFLDFNYAIYYLGTGLVALASKRIRWKI